MDHNMMSKVANAEEQKKWQMKHFDYAESRVKEWLASVINTDVKELFPDYTTERDVLMANHDNNTYMFSLEHEPRSYKLDNAFVKSVPTLDKSTMIMFQSVFTVFGPVVKTMAHFSEEFDFTYPEFDMKTMSFYLKTSNKLENKRQTAMKNIIEVKEYLGKLTKVKLVETAPDYKEKSVELQQIKTNLLKVQSEALQVLNGISEEDVRQEELRCNRRNKEFLKAPRLYLSADRTSDIPEELLVKRMPTFGLQYQDPLEDNYIDKLKKEYDVN